KDIPLIGGLFRSTLDRRDMTELFLFITPHVIATDEDLERATEGLKDSTQKLRERLPDPIPLLPDTLFRRLDGISPDSVVPADSVQRADTASAARRPPGRLRQRVVPPKRDPPDVWPCVRRWSCACCVPRPLAGRARAQAPHSKCGGRGPPAPAGRGAGRRVVRVLRGASGARA